MRAAGAMVALIPVLALAACTGAPAPAAGSTTPPVSATPAPVPADPTTPPTALQTWCAGNGYDSWSQVGADLSQLHADSLTGDLTALTSDGGQLVSDALAAGTSPPPLGRKHRLDYGLGMGWLQAAGNKIVNGDVTGATAAMRTADGYINDVSGLIDSGCLGT